MRASRAFAATRGLATQSTVQAVRAAGVGDPLRVFSLGSHKVAVPGAADVLVRLEASSIHPADVALARGLIAGGALGGSEGTGVVESVGSAVRGLKAGDRVVAMGLGIGTWAERGVFHSNHVFALKQSGSALAAEAAAALTPVCAAAQILADWAKGLQAGDVVLHAGGPGAMGMALSQVAAARGLRLVSVIRNRPGVDESVALLKEHGSFAAVSEDYARSAAFRKLLSDLPQPKLAINGLGGEAATGVARLLAPGSALVTYAGAAVRLPASLFVERGIRAEGFSLQRWFAGAGKDAAQRLVSDAERMVAEGKVKLMLERHGLSKFGAALARHQEPHRARKIVLDHAK